MTGRLDSAPSQAGGGGTCRDQEARPGMRECAWDLRSHLVGRQLHECRQGRAGGGLSVISASRSSRE